MGPPLPLWATHSSVSPPPSTCWPRCFWCSPGYGWPSGLQPHIAGSRDLLINQHSQVLLGKAALNPFIPLPVLISGVALTQVQDLSLDLVEPHEVHMGPLLELAQVPLDGILSLTCVDHTTQLAVICKLAEGAPDLAVCIIDEDIKQYWSKYGPLRNTTCHWFPSGHWSVDHCPLDVIIQLIPQPNKSLPIKSISLQFREKDVVGDHVKGLTQNQIDDSHSSSLVHWHGHSTIEGH